MVLAFCWLLWLLAAAAAGRRRLHLLDPALFRRTFAARPRAMRAGPELAEWALDAWQKAARPDLTFATAAAGPRANSHSIGRPAARGYTAKRGPLMVDGKRGAAIYVNPDVTQLGDEIDPAAARDPLAARRHCLSHLPARKRARPWPVAHRQFRGHHVQLRISAATLWSISNATGASLERGKISAGNPAISAYDRQRRDRLFQETPVMLRYDEICPNHCPACGRTWISCRRRCQTGPAC